MTYTKPDDVVLIIGAKADDVFSIHKNSFPLPQPEFDDLLMAHGDRLRALLDKPAILSVQMTGMTTQLSLSCLPVTKTKMKMSCSI
jgi:hypothetical protein